MEFGITQEEIDNEIVKIKEEQRIKEIAKEILQSQIEEVIKSFGKRFDDFQVKISEEVSSKDKEIESLNLELTSLKETIETLNRENLDLKSRISSVNDLVLSTQKKKIDPSPHSEEFFRRIKLIIRYMLKPYSNDYLNGAIKNKQVNEFRKVLNISEDEVKSPISKYIIGKIEKYFRKIKAVSFPSYQFANIFLETSVYNFPLLFKESFSKEIELAKNKYSKDIELNTFKIPYDASNPAHVAEYKEKWENRIKLHQEQFEYFLSILR
jgi:hypothetical protein